VTITIAPTLRLENEECVTEKLAADMRRIALQHRSMLCTKKTHSKF
jgi:hypothetical protein